MSRRCVSGTYSFTIETVTVSSLPASSFFRMLNPFDAANLQRIARAGVTGFAFEAGQHTTRTRMDVLSPHANIAGY